MSHEGALYYSFAGVPLWRCCPLVFPHPALSGAHADSEVAQGVMRIIDQEIRPAVAMDGGDVVFVKFENGIAYLRLRGACSGCPSAVFTLKMGIERRLREEFPEIQSVQAI